MAPDQVKYSRVSVQWPSSCAGDKGGSQTKRMRPLRRMVCTVVGLHGRLRVATNEWGLHQTALDATAWCSEVTRWALAFCDTRTPQTEAFTALSAPRDRRKLPPVPLHANTPGAHKTTCHPLLSRFAFSSLYIFTHRNTFFLENPNFFEVRLFTCYPLSISSS